MVAEGMVEMAEEPVEEEMEPVEEEVEVAEEEMEMEMETTGEAGLTMTSTSPSRSMSTGIIPP